MANHMINKSIFLCLIFSGASFANYASETATDQQNKWSYSECVDWAKSHNVDLRRINLEIQQSEEDIKSSKDLWLPSFDFSTGHSFSNYPFGNNNQASNSYNSSYSINGSWTVWEGNARKYRIESSKIMKQESELNAESRIDDLEVSIFQAYLNILYSKEAIQIAHQTLEVSQSQAKRAKALTESGRSSKVDLAQIESQLAQDEYALVQAQSNYESAKMKLKQLLELRLDYDIEIDDLEFADEIVMVVLPDKIEVYNQACQWNYSIRSNDLNDKVLDNNIKEAKAGYYPRISLTAGIGTGYTTIGTGNWGEQMGNGVNENIGLNLSIPIFDANSTKRSVAKAKLAALEGELNDEQLRNELSQTIENLYIEARSAQAKYISGQKQVESAELTAQLVDRQFELGLVNPLELLTSHNNLLNARLELLQSKYMAILSIKMINYYATQEISLP